MLAFFTTLAALATVQPAQPSAAANPHAPQQQMQGMDHSKMDHSKMDQSKMNHGDDCCKRIADGKIECAMMKTSGDSSAPNHSGH